MVNNFVLLFVCGLLMALAVHAAEDREAFLCRNLIQLVDAERGEIKYGLIHRDTQSAIKVLAEHPFLGRETHQLQDSIKGLLGKVNTQTSGRGNKKWDLAERLLRESLTSRLADRLPVETLRRVHASYDLMAVQYYDLLAMSTDHSSWVQRRVFQRWADIQSDELPARLDSLLEPLREACAKPKLEL